MGLDWMLDQLKPKDVESSAVFLQLKEQLHELRENGPEEDDDGKTDEAKQAEFDAKEKVLSEQLKAVSISCFEVIGAPQVGVDAEATEWFRENVYEPHRKAIAERNEKPGTPYHDHWMRPFEELVKEKHGSYVPALAKEKGGIAKYSGMMCGDLDFRGKCIGRSDVLQEVDPGLCGEAYEDHSADECVEYAERLEQAVSRYKNKHRDWESNEDAKHDIEAVRAGIDWLRFWGERGFGYREWS